MVEKNSLPSSLPQNVELKESRRGVLKHSDSPLKDATSAVKDKQQALDESRLSSSAIEVDQFNNLCDGVLTAHSMFEMCLTELLTLKNELLKHSLPSNLLINLTLTCSKLYRSTCDLSVPTNELIRLVRLYSAKWEAKSNVLKKIHEDYESKQRRLDLALKKLELVGVASERMEKEKKIMNWGKIFSKVMTAKSHGHRWKFLIRSLKEKVKSGDILSIPFPSNTPDEDPNEDTKTETCIPRHHRKSVQSLRHQSLLRREARNSRSSRTSDQQQEDNEVESELSSEEIRQEKHVMDTIRKNTPDSETRLSFTSSRFKSKYPFEGKEFTKRKTERMETPTGIRTISSPRATTPVRRLMPRNRDVSSAAKKSVLFFDELSSEVTKPTVCIKEEKSVWTGETEYDRFLHVRVYKPVCTKAVEPLCTVCFGDQMFCGSAYENNEGTTSGSTALPSCEGDTKKPSEASLKTKFQEFVFTLPDENVFVKGKPEEDITSQQLRIAVQPGKGAQMVAMCTVEYSVLKVLEKANEKEDFLCTTTAENHPLLSLLSDKETMFNSLVGHVPLVCYQSKNERVLSQEQSTQTSSIQELFNEFMERKRIEEEEIRKLKHEEPEKTFSETEFRALEQRHAEELECLRNEYEIQLKEIVHASKNISSDCVSPYQLESKFVSACTSPISMDLMPSLPSSPKAPQRPRTADARSSPTRKGRKIKTSQNLPEWGKDLPANFFDRLEQFSRASAKHHQELSEKTKKAIQENCELQMATQNRLDIADDNIDLNDVCLPALFMPSRMGTVYSPKASLYFHPSGISKNRFTQPPSVFKLPHAVERDRSSVVNLFDLSQTFLTSGPTWLIQNGRPRSASSAVPQKNDFSISTSLNVHGTDRCSKLKSE